MCVEIDGLTGQKQNAKVQMNIFWDEMGQTKTLNTNSYILYV